MFINQSLRIPNCSVIREPNYHLMVSSLDLYSSLVLMDGASSLIQIDSRVIRKACPLWVAASISVSSQLMVVLQILRCLLTGALGVKCSLKRVCRCRIVCPT